MTKLFYGVITPLNDKVVVKRGEIGFWENETLAVHLLKVQTKAETEAALVGSMFGWDCPGAQVENYDADGNYIAKVIH